MTTATRPTLGQLNEGSAGGKYFPFAKIGDRIEGKVTKVDIAQSTAMGTNELLWWDADKTQPKYDVIITLDTTLRDPEDSDDDGSRSCWFKWTGEQRRSIQKAIAEAGGGPDIYPGDYFTAVYTGTVPSKIAGLNPAKQYEIHVRRAPQNGSLSGLPASPPAQPAPATPAPPPAAAAPQTAAQPVPAQPPSMDELLGQFQKVKQLLALGLTPQAIHAAIPTMSLEQVEAVAAAPAS